MRPESINTPIPITTIRSMEKNAAAMITGITMSIIMKADIIAESIPAARTSMAAEEITDIREK